MAYRVLVVDDSPIIRRIVLRILKMLPFELASYLGATNREEALEILTNEWVDLMLCDINRPKMSGEELMRHLSQNPAMKDLPVVMVTSDRSTGRQELLMNLGAKGFVHKPVTPETLRDAIGIALGPQCFEGAPAQ